MQEKLLVSFIGSFVEIFWRHASQREPYKLKLIEYFPFFQLRVPQATQIERPPLVAPTVNFPRRVSQRTDSRHEHCFELAEKLRSAA